MDRFTPEELAKLAAEDQGPRARQIIIAFTIISFVLVGAINTAVCQVMQIQAGNGKHAIFIQNPKDISRILKFLFFSIISYNFSLSVTKISILLQYHRIFTLREMRVPVYVVLAIVSAWAVTALGTLIFSCVPVHAYWQTQDQEGANCVNREAIWYTNASVNIFTDLLVAVIPVPGIWGLQIPKQQKVALLAILTIGWFVCIVSILRIHALTILSRNLNDITYYSASTAYWSAIEVNLAIVCASLPALKPLLVRIIPVFGTRNNSRGQGSTTTSTNNHRLQKLGSRGIWKSGEGKEKLRSNSSNAQSLASRPSESDRRSCNILVTKHFEQHIENSEELGDGDSQEGIIVRESYACRNVQQIC